MTLGLYSCPIRQCSPNFVRPILFSYHTYFAFHWFGGGYKVLSVVYQVYIQAIADIRNRTNRNKEEALRFSFLALEKLSSNKNKGKAGLVDIVFLEQVMQVLRPHYQPSKVRTYKLSCTTTYYRT